MNLIIYAPEKNDAHALAESLHAAGHLVLAHATSLNHLQHLVGEFGAHGLVLDAVPPAAGCAFAAGACVPSFYHRMAAQGYAVCTPPQVWEAALPLCAPSQPIDELVENAAVAFEQYMGGRPTGLSRLPAAWLAGLPNILKRLAGSEDFIPWFVAGVAAKHGILELELHQEESMPPPPIQQKSRRLELRKALNLALYPSLWRPLNRRHWFQLYHERPDLRELLCSHPFN